MNSVEWSSLVFYVGIATGLGAGICHCVAGYYHLRYYRLRRREPETWKCQPQRFLTPTLNRNAVFSGTANLTLGGLLTGIFIYAVDHGLPTMLYYDVADYGWAYTIVSVPMFFARNDASAYYVHRALHLKPLYRSIHKYHHRFVATSPYVATALHPGELLALQAASFAPIFLMPLHPVVVGFVLVYILVFNIIDQSGVRLVSRLPWQGPSMYHDDHHAHFHVDFGQHLMILDRLHGTLRREGRRYGDSVFGGCGEKQSGSGSHQGFVKY